MEPNQVCRVYTNEITPIFAASVMADPQSGTTPGDTAYLRYFTGTTIDEYTY